MFYVNGLNKASKTFFIKDTSDGQVDECTIEEIKGFVKNGIKIKGVCNRGIYVYKNDLNGAPIAHAQPTNGCLALVLRRVEYTNILRTPMDVNYYLTVLLYNEEGYNNFLKLKEERGWDIVVPATVRNSINRGGKGRFALRIDDISNLDGFLYTGQSVEVKSCKSDEKSVTCSATSPFFSVNEENAFKILYGTTSINAWFDGIRKLPNIKE